MMACGFKSACSRWVTQSQPTWSSVIPVAVHPAALQEPDALHGVAEPVGDLELGCAPDPAGLGIDVGHVDRAIVFMILQTTTASQMPASTICAARASAPTPRPPSTLQRTSVMPSSRTIAPVSGGG